MVYARDGKALQAHAVAIEASSLSDCGEIDDSLGALFARLGDHQRALELFRRACARNTNDPRLLFNLAMGLLPFGRQAEAEIILDKVISLAPRDYQAMRERSELRRQTKDKNHILELRSELSQPHLSWQGKVQLNFALGKELEDIGALDAAFDAFSAGAQKRRQNMHYNVLDEIVMMAAIGDAFGKSERRWSSIASDRPIFVLGLPRAGTTLVETILGRHPDVTQCGELTNFTTELMRLTRQGLASSAAPSELIDSALACDRMKLGEAYLAATGYLSGSTPRFTDKMPLNFLNVGFILEALPHAKIINVTRDPIDLGYALFKTIFATAYPFSYDLDELGSYMAGYERLMALWRRLFPQGVIDVNYEDLVKDTEPQIRRLLYFCGLDWREECAKPEQTRAAVATASASQVREPIYTRSVGSGRRVRHRLTGFEQRLKAEGVIAS